MHSVLAVVDWSSVLGQVGTGALTVLVVPLVLFLLPKIPVLIKNVFAWLDAQAKNVHNVYAQGVLLRLSLLIQANVLAAEQTEASVIKAQAATGTITADAAKVMLAKVKADVLQKVKDAANAQQLWAAGLYVFSGSEGDLSKWVDTVTEAHVNSLPPSLPPLTSSAVLGLAVP